MNQIKSRWLKLPIQRKTRSYAIVLILITAFVGIFNIYVVNDTLQSMGRVLNDMICCENVYSAFRGEEDALNRLLRNRPWNQRKRGRTGISLCRCWTGRSYRP